jgi:hypothetical protein
LGYGSSATAINSTGQVTGSIYSGIQSVSITNTAAMCTVVCGYPMESEGRGEDMTVTISNSHAFRTGANGVGDTVFGTANGIASYGTAINDSGEVGGYIALANGTDEAFLTTAHGGLLVGLGVGAPGDSAEVLFLNNSGQAIIEDTTTADYYLYSGGSIVALTSLGSAEGDPVVGFNNAGQILLGDPDLLTPTTPGTDISTLPGAYSDVGTAGYAAVASAQGYAPTSGSTFFTDPSSSTDASFSAYSGSSAGSSVPAPASGLLLGFGILLARLRRRGRVSA